MKICFTHLKRNLQKADSIFLCIFVRKISGFKVDAKEKKFFVKRIIVINKGDSGRKKDKIKFEESKDF